MTVPFGVLGHGSQAWETAEYAAPDLPQFYAVSGGIVHGHDPMIDLETTNPEYTSVPVVAAVGAPGLRRDVVGMWSGSAYRTVVARSADISMSAEIRDGCIIGAHAVLTAGVQLGGHVIVNVGATISHGSVVGDFATISPGVHIAGDCVVGAGVFLGIGAVVSNGIHIVEGAVVGAGAVVVDDITMDGIWVGVPARRLRSSQGWLQRI
ncbi:hexapeptide transferase [Cryobacterium algoricola]|uniref:Hexapeptide transferase n=1 Tax=Cryobacterium algoricola TaxID=1259183 RepID=A0ABY2I9U2_9MICO|nr:hexapeptide transferase [Cryobacterium algoricola]